VVLDRDDANADLQVALPQLVEHRVDLLGQHAGVAHHDRSLGVPVNAA